MGLNRTFYGTALHTWQEPKAMNCYAPCSKGLNTSKINLLKTLLPESSNERNRKEEFDLNISRYVSTTLNEEIIDLNEVNRKLVDLDKDITKARETHNQFLAELGLPPI